MDTMKSAKLMLLEEVLVTIRNELGSSPVIAVKAQVDEAPKKIPTHISTLNEQLKGGFDTGKILELYGREGVGKTTFALKLAAEVQRVGKLAAFVDVERTFDRRYAISCGIEESSLWLAEPNSEEEALVICEKLLNTELFGVIILDSVAALSPKRDTERSSFMEIDSPLQSRILSQALRRISHTICGTKTLLVFVNQLRDRPTTLHFEGETTPGGASLKFLADYRLKICDKENDFVLAKQRKL